MVGRASFPRATHRRARPRSRSCSVSSRASTVAALVTSRSLSCSRPTAESSQAPAFSQGALPASLPAPKALATTRSSFRTARNGRWRSWGTSGKQSTPIGLVQLALSCELSVTLAPPPVDLAAEDDHVRHHVEPEQEDRGAAQRSQGHVDVGEAHEDR